jgi:hypothetical protein
VLSLKYFYSKNKALNISKRDLSFFVFGTKRKDVPSTTNSKKKNRRKGMQMKEKRVEDVALKKRGKGVED